MIIHRSQPEGRFTIIPDDTARDPRLSYLARGVLAEILSRPDDWETTADAMWTRARRERGQAGEGRRVLRSAFAELSAAGYMHRARSRVGGGRFVTELHVFDAPAERLPDGTPVVLAAIARFAEDVSAGGTDDQTGSRRSDLGKPASSQVAPTTSPPTVGPPVVGPPVVGRLVVSTETEDGDLSTEILNGDPRNTDIPPVLTSPEPVEGNGAAPVQDQDLPPEEGQNGDGYSGKHRVAALQVAAARQAREAAEAEARP